eukprot:CAMPEP_0181179946 /NCGR_PEP_ID=MMETSP1096-20121128/6534_1 /TAXON_ID=156174 ORGANISM="Chrysochromulina ericina, Strain CCMP281" /NCGR_SAMPLE_ID=MMETSP1096 /ASSEMBLY_ACC=CAM_ASM_000453 /LENGTH=350 /DNA_ID=CAMNT_0023268335 /DNA_START=197 /DNA_END=1249 /DNA_ORIENTATION=+
MLKDIQGACPKLISGEFLYQLIRGESKELWEKLLPDPLDRLLIECDLEDERTGYSCWIQKQQQGLQAPSQQELPALGVVRSSEGSITAVTLPTLPALPAPAAACAQSCPRMQTGLGAAAPLAVASWEQVSVSAEEASRSREQVLGGAVEASPAAMPAMMLSLGNQQLQPRFLSAPHRAFAGASEGGGGQGGEDGEGGEGGGVGEGGGGRGGCGVEGNGSNRLSYYCRELPDERLCFELEPVRTDRTEPACKLNPDGELPYLYVTVGPGSGGKWKVRFKRAVGGGWQTTGCTIADDPEGKKSVRSAMVSIHAAYAGTTPCPKRTLYAAAKVWNDESKRQRQSATAGSNIEL